MTGSLSRPAKWCDLQENLHNSCIGRIFRSLLIFRRDQDASHWN